MNSHLRVAVAAAAYAYAAALRYPHEAHLPPTNADDPLDAFVYHARQCLPWQQPITRVGACGNDYGVPCNQTELALACLNTTGCNEFNSNGFLKQCPGGACDCHGGSDACRRGQDIFSSSWPMYGCDHTDMYTIAGAPAPPEWAADISAANYLYAAQEPPTCYMPEVGNGYVGTVISWGAMYIGGLFNGKCGSVGRARLPSTVAVDVANGEMLGAALDMRNAVYRRRWSVSNGSSVGIVESRVYTHRARRRLLLLEFEWLAGNASSVWLNLTSLWTPLAQTTSQPGDGCAGGFTVDLSFRSHTRTHTHVTTPGQPVVYQAWPAVTTAEGDYGELFNVTVVTADVTSGLLCVGACGRVVSVITSVATSLDFPGHSGTSDEVTQLALAELQDALNSTSDELFAEHTAAWQALLESGMDVTCVSEDPADVARAWDLATHINSSRYFVYSSIRDDWSTGVSPGGLATQNYQGAVFMDEDWWVEPSLALLAPSLAASVQQYRFNTIPTAQNNAKLFGYNGTMYAWTAAYLGRPFGCCSGRGEYEDCLEQHVTGDVAFSAWQYFAATGNVTWLAEVGFPILAGAAVFHMSRVNDELGNINGILPIDEWCVGSGCGCETPGVSNDVQMNAVAKLSLLLAAEAADILGVNNATTEAWRAMGQLVPLLFNATGNHHNQFTSPTCPNGWGGSHYSPSHTICPIDVLMLSYPMGDALGIPLAVTAADAAVFMPITCMENAGMTTPMHAIVNLMLNDSAGATAELNRSMHAAAYGPFNVRNEVDKHSDVIGGHFDNTHFVTGDGGFLQAILFGYGGLRITLDGLRVLGASVPESVGTLTLRGLAWRGLVLSIDITALSATWSLLSGTACMTDATNSTYALNATAPLVLSHTFAYPATLRDRPC